MSKKSKLRSSKLRSSIAEEYDFGELDVNPLIRDFMIREAFNMFDEDHSGDIDKREFSKLINTLGLELNEKRQLDLMKEMDKDGSGTIDYDEFFAIMCKFQFGKESPIQIHLESTFNDYDKNMDSLITADDFKKVSEELDTIPISQEDAEMFITFCKHFGKEKGIISERNDAVTLEEFINTLVNLNFLLETKNDEKRSNKQGSFTGHADSNPNRSQMGESQGGQSEKYTNSLFKKSEKNANVSKSESYLG